MFSAPTCPFNRTSAVVASRILPLFTVSSVSTCRPPVLTTQEIALLETAVIIFIVTFTSDNGGVPEVIKLYGMHAIRVGGRGGIVVVGGGRR